MLRSYDKLIRCILVLSLSVVFCVEEFIYADSTVNIIINPNKTKIHAGSEAIALTAKIIGKDLQYHWTVVGPGEISEADISAVFYTPPATLRGNTAQAIVTVRVTDESGQQTTDSVTFDILPTTQETSIASNEGMSKTTKIALGAGAVAALGGGVALLAGGGDEGDDEEEASFTGTFIHVDSNDRVTRTLALVQHEKTLTGNYTREVSDPSCCTASITVEVNGEVTGNSAIIYSGSGYDECQGANGCTVSTSLGGYTYQYTLIDNGNMLHDEYYNRNFVRQ